MDMLPHKPPTYNQGSLLPVSRSGSPESVINKEVLHRIYGGTPSDLENVKGPVHELEAIVPPVPELQGLERLRTELPSPESAASELSAAAFLNDF